MIKYIFKKKINASMNILFKQKKTTHNIIQIRMKSNACAWFYHNITVSTCVLYNILCFNWMHLHTMASFMINSFAQNKMHLNRVIIIYEKILTFYIYCFKTCDAIINVMKKIPCSAVAVMSSISSVNLYGFYILHTQYKT